MYSSNHATLRKFHSMRIFALFLVSFLLLGIPQYVYAATDPTPGVAVIFTNDVHCSYAQAQDKEGNVSAMGYDYVKGYVNELDGIYGADNTTLVDDGDAIQGGQLGTLTNGQAIIDLMNATGYDYAIPGNHEFDYGMQQFFTLSKQFKGKYLSANFEKTDGTQVLPAYDLKTYANVKDAHGDTLQVAYVGISTPETLTKSSPASFQDASGNYIYDFCNDETGAKLYQRVQSAVDQARAAGADYVVALAHLGESGSTQRWTSDAVIANTTGIDAMLDGHSHESYSKQVKNKQGQNVLLAQTGTKLENIGVLVIDPDDAQPLSIEMTPASKMTNSDPEVAALVKKYSDELDKKLKQIVGHTDVDLTTHDVNDPSKRLVRTQETNMGDLVADVYRSTFKEAQIGLANGGGVRASIKKGDITLGDIINVLPFNNEICLVEVSGQDILDALEMGARNYPDENGGFLQVSGMSYKIDPTIASTVEVDAHGNFVRVAGNRRVYDVKVAGQPIDPHKTYKVASHGYMLLQGGDGLSMFKHGKVLYENVKIDNQAMIDYITKDLHGNIDATSEYAQPLGAGRIVIAKQQSNAGGTTGGTTGTGGATTGQPEANHTDQAAQNPSHSGNDTTKATQSQAAKQAKVSATTSHEKLPRTADMLVIYALGACVGATACFVGGRRMRG